MARASKSTDDFTREGRQSRRLYLVTDNTPRGIAQRARTQDEARGREGDHALDAEDQPDPDQVA